MMKKQLLSALAMAVLATTQAYAFDDPITLPANRTSGFATFSANSPDCHMIGKPRMTVPVKPQHGTVSFKWIVSRLGDSAGICKGKQGHMMGVFYTPNKGYRGEDHFRIGMSFPKYDFANGSEYKTEDVSVIIR